MMQFYVGIVEDRDDPQQLGRVRVRIFGYHTDDKVMIPTEDLPWATVMHPVTSAANSGVGHTANLVEGTQVMVYFTDGREMQYPVVIGSLPGYNNLSLTNINGREQNRYTSRGFQDPNFNYPTPEYMNDVDTPKAARTNHEEHDREQHDSENDLFRIVEPEDIRGESQYPFNNVRQTEAGHIEEFDNTPGFERISVQHVSGSFRETRPDGTVVDKIEGSNYTIVAEGNNVYVEGVCNLHVNNTCNTYINGDYNLTVTGNHNVNVEGNLNETVTGDVIEVYQSNQTITVAEALSETVTGDVTETYESNQTVSVSDNMNENIGGNQTTGVGGNVDIDATEIYLN